jgi:hypothetical protein
LSASLCAFFVRQPERRGRCGWVQTINNLLPGIHATDRAIHWHGAAHGALQWNKPK